MNAPQLIVARFTELVESGKPELAINYLSPDIIYNSWMGVVEGRDNVVNFLRDNVRFSHHSRSYERWRVVQHSLEPHLWEAGSSPRPIFDDTGYDPDGFATFERNGTISTRPRFVFERVRVKETIVVQNGLIILVNVSKRL
ncbi:unnamed protein product [Phytomonas sp. EM1]|nr:unnamed protein product [Phytomonas sp. EM1]|eukprot:CCW61489.1 unnamed protein product [Phytomonas sp. isolate EM1]